MYVAAIHGVIRWWGKNECDSNTWCNKVRGKNNRMWQQYIEWDSNSDLQACICVIFCQNNMLINWIVTTSKLQWEGSVIDDYYFLNELGTK